MARQKSVKSIVYNGVKIDLEDFTKEVKGNLKKLQKKGLTRVGTALVKEVKANTPKRTGLLRATINKQIKVGNGNVPFLKIGALKVSKSSKFRGSFAFHAHLIEFGTGTRFNKTKPKRFVGKVKEYKYIRGTIANKKDLARKYVAEELSKIGPGVLPDIPDFNP